MGAVADGDAHAVEVQILEVQELGLGTATFTADRNSGARSIFRLSGNRLAARNASNHLACAYPIRKTGVHFCGMRARRLIHFSHRGDANYKGYPPLCHW